MTNTLYYYWVKGKNSQGISEYSAVGSNRTYPAVPVEVDFDIDDWGYNYVALVVNIPLSNITAYTVFRSTIETDTNAYQSVGFIDGN